MENISKAIQEWANYNIDIDIYGVVGALMGYEITNEAIELAEGNLGNLEYDWEVDIGERYFFRAWRF